MARSADFLAGLGAEPERGNRNERQRKAGKPAGKAGSFDDMAERVEISLFQRVLKRYFRELAATGGFAVLLGAAIVNAVFLQAGKHPAPLFAGDAVSRTVTAAIPKPREILLDKGDSLVEADPLVSEIQRHLAARGYYNSEIDGLMGARTRAAIGVYQRAFGEIVTNEASRQLLEHIRLSNPDRDYHAKARQRVAEAEEKAVRGNEANPVTVRASIDVIGDPERIKQIQRALSKLGYNLTDDGIIGPNTRQAIVEFKKKRGLEVDDTITLTLFNELIKLKQL